MDSLNLMIDTVHNNSEFIILDTETTGFSYSSGARLIELSCYKIKNGNIDSIFTSLFNPCIPIPDKITEITGIDDSMVRVAPLLEDKYIDIISFFGDTPIVCHNVKFDLDNILIPMFRNMFYLNIANRNVCTLELARAFMKDLKSKKLGSLYEYLTGNKTVNQHRALGDVAMTLEVFNKFKAFIDNNYDGIVNRR